MTWPGDDTLTEWLEDCAKSREEAERKRLSGRILNLLFNVVVLAVNSWRKRNGYPRLPFGQEIEDYYGDISLALYRRMLGWVYGSTVTRHISFPYLWRTAYGIIQDRFSQEVEEERRSLDSPGYSEGSEVDLDYAGLRSPAAGPEEVVMHRDCVVRAWWRLTSMQRMIMWRFHYENHSMTRIARDLNVSISKVSRHYGRARKIFEEELAAA